MPSMELTSENNGKLLMGCWPHWLLVSPLLFRKLWLAMVSFCRKMKKLADDDPRRVLHSFKVGIALTMVSTLYYVTPIFKGFRSSTIWAVLTVVLVLEFTVGGTLTKGLNRAVATLLAAALGMGAHHMAILAGGKGEVILLGFFIFIVAVIATFLRFMPEIKKRYDYGVMIFILTFSLVGISSFRVDETFVLAYKRLLTIAIGVAISLVVSVLVFPVWAGEDLHMLTCANLEKLANSLEGLEALYFGEMVKVDDDMKIIALLQSCKIVLNTKATEDSLANLARWEPPHGRFWFSHPWKQYLKIGGLSRHFAYLVEALSSYISRSQVATELEKHGKIRETCKEICKESKNTMIVMASSVKAMTKLSDSKQHMAAATEAANRLKSSLFEGGLLLRETLQTCTIVSLLLEIVCCAQDIEAAVEDLARLARFKNSDQVNAGSGARENPMAPVNDEVHEVAMVVVE